MLITVFSYDSLPTVNLSHHRRHSTIIHFKTSECVTHSDNILAEILVLNSTVRVFVKFINSTSSVSREGADNVARRANV